MHEAGEAVCERLARYSAAVYTASINALPSTVAQLSQSQDLASRAGTAAHLLYC